MKKFISLLLTCSIFFGLFGCSAKNTGTRELRNLGLDPARGKTTLRVSSDGGFHGSNFLKLIVEFKHDIREDLQKDSRWLPCPMDEETSTWVRNELDGVSRFADRLRNGYYILLSDPSHNPKDADVKGNYDFIMAVYDLDRRVMYYCQASAA